MALKWADLPVTVDLLTDKRDMSAASVITTESGLFTTAHGAHLCNISFRNTVVAGDFGCP